MTEPLSREDGLPMRDSGAWARDKLYYVGRYMSIFNTGMKNRWPQRSFLDLMAGPGRCCDRDTGEEFDGSPVMALALTEPPFTSAVFVEANPALASALSARTAVHATLRTVLEADCNAEATIAQIRSLISTRSLTLCFVDNLGLNVRFDTLAALASGGRSIDFLITFQVNDLTRNIDLALSNPDAGARLDAFFGSPDWRGVVQRFDRGEIQTLDRATALADFYAERFATALGYAHSQQLRRVMRNTRNAPLYRLMIVSRHERAIEFFRKIAAIEHDGQRDLFR